jgi:hypothetical protein
MKRKLHARLALCLALGLLGLAPGPNVRAQEKSAVGPGGVVNITVASAAASAPLVSITLLDRHGHVTPHQGKCSHTGGGLIDVTSPSPDTVIITMTGAVVANSEMRFELDQDFKVKFDDPKVKAAKLTLEGRVMGLLRSHCKGGAEQGEACATVNCGPAALATVAVEPHSVACGENLTVNCHVGPVSAPVVPAVYTLHETFFIAAHSECWLLKKPSAEFAPDPALEPLWISSYEPFHGVNKKDLGFQVILKVAAEEEKKEEAKDK